MDDLLKEFLSETTESLGQIDVQLVTLEKEPNSPGLINNIFRLVHTIKGTCGFLNLPRLETVAHHAENLLGLLRAGDLPVRADGVTLILEAIDRIKLIMVNLEATGAEPEGDDTNLIQRLDTFAAGEAAEKLQASEVGRNAPAEDGSLETPDTAKPDVSVPSKAAGEAAKPLEAPASGLVDLTVRVPTATLDQLMDLAGELVLARNQIMQFTRSRDMGDLAGPVQNLSHVTSELQEAVMKTRMQPVGNAWAKLPRLIRDLSNELKKRIDLQMLGAETEIDRQVLELIKDPLTHMVRNSADHGLETPEERRAAGKPEVGIVKLEAFHEGGHIIIRISDDGRGLALDRIKAKAVERGMVGEAELAQLTPAQIRQFIMKPGFSTAAAITNVSGRGVGMDVVKTNIEKIGGTVEVDSTEGKGSTFTIKIPLTLAIVSALVVRCREQRFALPQITVREIVHVSQAPGSQHRIEWIKSSPILRLREKILPLVSLERVTGLGGGQHEDADVLVIQIGGLTFGLIVDAVVDTEEIVVKPLSRLMKGLTQYSGCTILGDGTVIMILDPNGLSAALGDVERAEETAVSVTVEGAQTQSLLLVSAGGQRYAVPLALVSRLEDIETKAFERAGNRITVQYQGRLMPIVGLRPDWTPSESGLQAVVVFSDQDRSMGLAVDEIVEIVEDVLAIDLPTKEVGVLGGAIIAGKATDLIDINHHMQRAWGDWFRSRTSEKGHTRILAVDDSSFFRSLLAPILRTSGYEVVIQADPRAVLTILERDRNWAAVLTDIEMPEMSGYELAKAIKANPATAHMPIVALSSRSSEADIEKGREAGFSHHIPKLNQDQLLAALGKIASTNIKEAA